ncbi:MAG: TIM barrel protein [Clostridia bacterium]|nr:TIM barrel protein [Clostridia bacterium]
MIRFGPSGNSEAFYAEGYKETAEAPAWINAQGLNAFEYAFTLGQFLSDKTAQKIVEEGKKYDIEFSVHAPFYINFANSSDSSRENNYKFMMNSVEGLKKLRGRHCVFHIGAQMKMSREEAFNNVKTNFLDFVREFEKRNDGVFLCPETMGKYTQIGSVDEIFEVCSWSDCLIPTLDFGHINCILQGALRTKDDFKKILQLGIDKIGFDKMKDVHVHFSKIMYGAKGEIKHLTFEDTSFGPEPEPFLEAVCDLGLEPVVITESSGTQAMDAAIMSRMYKIIKKEK